MWFFRKKTEEYDDYYDEDKYDILLYNADADSEEQNDSLDSLVIEDEPKMEQMHLPVNEPEEEVEETPEPEKEEETPKKQLTGWRKTVLTYAHDVLYLLAFLVLLSLVLRVVVVDGTSMNNTLKDGDYLLVLSNVFYRDPKLGDIIVASKETFDDGAPIVKRVIATAGQEVDIDFEEGIVYINDKPLDEEYTLTPTNLQEGMEFPLVVPDGCLFVLGDNRNGSRDSRHPSIGLIDKREVIGKVIFLFLPGTNGTDYSGNPNESRDFSRIGAVH